MRRSAIVLGIAGLLVASPTLGQQEEAPAARNEPSARVYAATPQDESWKQDVLVALIGGGARFRRVRLSVGDGMGGREPRDLDTGAYFDFGWHLLIRPLGHRSPRATIRAMVLQIDGGAGIDLTVQPAGSGISLNTNTWRMVGQFGYLYSHERWQLGGLVGIGGDVFNIDLNSVLPSSRIVYVRLGPAASYDIVDQYLQVRTDFGLRFPFHLGELRNTFGHDTRAFGLDSVVTFQGRIKAGFTYSFRFIWEYFTYRFTGPSDSVPAAAQGGRGNDHALDVQLLVGWSL